MYYRTTSNPSEPLAVNSKIAATLLASTSASLEKDRAVGHMGIPFVKAGRRVIYLISDLDAWLKANRIVPEAKAAQRFEKVEEA
jgi:hypothetical protein